MSEKATGRAAPETNSKNKPGVTSFGSRSRMSHPQRSSQEQKLAWASDAHPPLPAPLASDPGGPPGVPPLEMSFLHSVQSQGGRLPLKACLSFHIFYKPLLHGSVISSLLMALGPK